MPAAGLQVHIFPSTKLITNVDDGYHYKAYPPAILYLILPLK